MLFFTPGFGPAVWRVMDDQARIDQKINQSFACQRCTECCRQPGFVYMTEGECEDAARYLKLSIYDFMDKYCDLIERRKIVLKKVQGEVCIFLEDDGCVIHQAKPSQCRGFPFKWRTPRSFDYCQGLKKLFNESDV